MFEQNFCPNPTKNESTDLTALILRSLQLIKPCSTASFIALEYEIRANSGEYTLLTENV